MYVSWFWKALVSGKASNRKAINSPLHWKVWEALLYIVLSIGNCLWFQSPAKVCIYRNLKILIRFVPTTVLKEHFESGFIEPLKLLTAESGERPSVSNCDDDLWTLLTAMLSGLEMALKDPSPPQNVPSLLWKAFETICNLCPVESVSCKSIT